MAIPKPANPIPQYMRNADPEIADFIDKTDVPGAAFYLWNLLKAKADKTPGIAHPVLIQNATNALNKAYAEIKNDPVKWVSNNISVPVTQEMRDNAAIGIPIQSNAFITNNKIAQEVGMSQVDYLIKKNVELKELESNARREATKYKLQKQILDQGTTGKWTGEGFGSVTKNASAMADSLMSVGIDDIRQFGQLPDGSYGNKVTGQPISQNYSRAGGNIWGGTFTGKDSTGFGVQFAPDGTPYFYTQQGASTSDAGNIVPIVALGLSLFAPGIGTAIGTALGATGTAATVLGGAIVSGTMAELSGGDFVDGAIKGAISAGVAPAVSSTIGSAVADAMADSVFKNVVTNAVTSAATSAVSAGLSGGDAGQAALAGALVGAGSAAGQELGIAAKYGTDAFSQQTQALLSQEQGLGGASQIGGTLGAAAGKIAAGADAEQVLTNTLVGAVAQEVTSALKSTVNDAIKQSPALVAEGADKEQVVEVPGSENLAALTGGQGVDVAGPVSVSAALPYNLENLPKDFPVPAGYRVLSMDEMFGSPREMRDAGIDVRYSDPIDGREAIIVPDSIGKIRQEGGQVLIEPTKPLDVIAPTTPIQPPQEAPQEVAPDIETGVSTDTSLPSAPVEAESPAIPSDPISILGETTAPKAEIPIDTSFLGTPTVTSPPIETGVSTDTSLPGSGAPGDTVDGGVSTDTSLPSPDAGTILPGGDGSEVTTEEEETGVSTDTSLPKEEPPQGCGEGYHWDADRQLCIPDSDVDESEECPEGYVRNLSTGACEPVSSSTATTGGGTVVGGGVTGGTPVTKQKVSVAAIPSSFFIPESPIVSAPSINDDPVMGGALPFEQQETKFQGPLDRFLEIAMGSSFVPRRQQIQQPEQEADTMDNRFPYPQIGSDYFNYGQQSDIESNLYPQQNQNDFDQPMDSGLPFKRGGMASPLMAGGGTTRYGRYAGGGLNVINHSGKQRIDFRQGDAVTGAGDGQSDDIPAMLADGEFVFPADVVAALGNGSTKAGSDKLYDMMHSIRAYHRSAKPEDLPPPAKKSPLDYLKKAKKARS